MLKQSFFGLGTPQIEYQTLDPAVREPSQVPVPQRVTLLLNGSANNNHAIGCSVGDAVKTGQALGDGLAVSSVTGTIAAIEPFAGDFGRTYTAVTIDVASEDMVDEAFASLTEAPSLETALRCYQRHRAG